MKTLKKLGLILTALVFCLSLAVTASYAQGKGKHKGWAKQKKQGIVYNVGYQDGRYYDRNGRRITAQEYRRLQRQRSRIYRSRDRYYRDGSLSYKERQKLAKQRSKYKRSVRKAYRN